MKYADGHRVMVDTLHHKLSRHRHHGPQGRARIKIGVAVGLEELTGDVGDNQADGEMGPTMAVYRDAG